MALRSPRPAPVDQLRSVPEPAFRVRARWNLPPEVHVDRGRSYPVKARATQVAKTILAGLPVEALELLLKSRPPEGEEGKNTLRSLVLAELTRRKLR